MDSSDEENAIIVAAAATVACAAAYYEHYILKEPCHHSILSGHMHVNEVLNGNKSRCRDLFRMDKRVFCKLCNILHDKSLLHDTCGISIEEQLAIFLLTIGHNDCNRVLQELFQHSDETFNCHFNNMLNAILALAPDFFQPPDIATAPEILSNPTFYPYFMDCVGAIDGMHIPAMVNVGNKDLFRNKKGLLSQCVFAACSFDLRFQYVLAGWEGSASDSRVLSSALTRADRLHVPEGKYYLVDGKYANIPGFIAPYRGARYRLSEFAGSHHPENAKELFNYRHSSLRSAIDRTFGVLKERFPILKVAPPYPFKTQVKLVIAACIIHNHIRKEKRNDWLFREYEQGTTKEEPKPQHDNKEIASKELPKVMASEVLSQRRQREIAKQFRESITDAMWSDHRRAA